MKVLNYQTLGPLVKNILDTKNIVITFKNRNSHYIDLEI